MVKTYKMKIPKATFLHKIMGRLSYRTKFYVGMAMFMIALLIMAYFMVSAQNTLINFSELELKGNYYQRHLRGLLENVTNHQILASRYLNGNKDIKEEMNSLQARINSNLKNLDSVNRELKEVLQASPEQLNVRNISAHNPTEIGETWAHLSRQVFLLTPDKSRAMHTTLIANIKGLILHIADTANLRLDPEIETNYLLTTTLFELPEVQVLIPQVMLVGEGILNRGTATEEEKIELLQLITLLEYNVSSTEVSTTQAFEEKVRVHDDTTTRDRLEGPFENYMTAVEKFIAYTKKSFLSGADISGDVKRFINLGVNAQSTSFDFWDVANKRLDELLKKRISKYKTQQRFSLGTAILIAVSGFAFRILVMHELNVPIHNLITASKHLANGDLSIRVPVTEGDEMGQVCIAFNQMSESFQVLIGQLQRAGIQLTTSSTQIAAAAKEQEATVVEQEATTKEIASTAHEISATAKDFARTMSEVSTSAEDTSALALAGREDLSRMEKIMQQLVDASQNIASKLAILNERAGTITNVITTITKVADQTNLLSLNAAIEAEKAGEHGRSFSVIAREIRRLADQTANATLDIEKMVNEMVSAVSAGVMGVDKFTEEIRSGVTQVNRVSEQLAKIMERVQDQTDSFESVNKGMQAQSLGAEQINDSINQLSEAAQQTTKSIRQFHRAIEELNKASKDMQSAVTKINQ